MKKLLLICPVFLSFLTIAEANGSVYVTDRTVNNQVIQDFNYHLENKDGKKFELQYDNQKNQHYVVDLEDGEYTLLSSTENDKWDKDTPVTFSIDQDKQVVMIYPKHFEKPKPEQPPVEPEKPTTVETEKPTTTTQTVPEKPTKPVEPEKPVTTSTTEEPKKEIPKKNEILPATGTSQLVVSYLLGAISFGTGVTFVRKNKK